MQYAPSQSLSTVPPLAASGPASASPAVSCLKRPRRQLAPVPKDTRPLSLSAAATPEAFIHDVRNLLTGLALYAELLNAPGVLSEPYRRYAAELCLLAQRSCALLGQAMEPVPAGSSAEASKPPAEEDGPVRWRGEPLCDPGAVLRRFLPLLQAQTEGAAEVILRLPRSATPLPVSGEALERITANLVCNAAQAMRAAGEREKAAPGCIWIALQVRDGAARLSVEDSGPGMPTSAAARFISPAALPPVRRGDRRGWGHRIIHALVTETGGRLAVRPRPAGGAVVTIVWPLPSAAALRVYPDDSGVAVAC